MTHSLSWNRASYLFTWLSLLNLNFSQTLTVSMIRLSKFLTLHFLGITKHDCFCIYLTFFTDPQSNLYFTTIFCPILKFQANVVFISVNIKNLLYIEVLLIGLRIKWKHVLRKTFTCWKCSLLPLIQADVGKIDITDIMFSKGIWMCCHLIPLQFLQLPCTAHYSVFILAFPFLFWYFMPLLYL